MFTAATITSSGADAIAATERYATMEGQSIKDASDSLSKQTSLRFSCSSQTLRGLKPPQPGITTAYGSMYAGKSNELARQVSRHRAVGYNVLLLNHKRDTRFHTESDQKSGVRTHDRRYVEGYSTDNLMSWLETREFADADMVAIDEGQWYGDELLEFALTARNVHHKRVIVAALNNDFYNQPFDAVHKLINHSDETIQCNAFCHVCGGTAIYTRCMVDPKASGAQGNVLVGGADIYRACCYVHWAPPPSSTVATQPAPA